MPKLRFGIYLKLSVFWLMLFTIPWLGYQYVWELESYLRLGQEQTMVGTARAVATALHERPSLFDQKSAYLKDVKPGTDLYAHKIVDPIRLDGDLADWQDYQHLLLSYNEQQLLEQTVEYSSDSLQFKHMVGQYKEYLYAMFNVQDDDVVFRSSNSLRVDRNDHLLIALTDPSGALRRYIVAPTENGWVNAYLLDEPVNSYRPVRPETSIQGYWHDTETGYNLELRFPLSILKSNIAFAVVDIDDAQSRIRQFSIGTANPNEISALGTVLVPSPEIERIVKGLKYSNARVWVVDKHKRVMARSGDILESTGFSGSQANLGGLGREKSWWRYMERNWLLPIYYQILTKPPETFVDELQDAYALQGQETQRALSGNVNSHWRLTPDSKAVVLSAAHPIYINDQVMGAVIVEQTTHGIRTLRNRALEQLFHVILAVVGIGTLAMVLFAWRISFRIRRLRNQTEQAIDVNGKIVGTVPVSSTQDEIGDLSRTFTNVLDKLAQYNAYLENMASRLSHELRTPVAIVNSSLENLSLEEQTPAQSEYVERAQNGIRRLSKILTNMSEATRLEQAMRANEMETFDVCELLKACTDAYTSTYTERDFIFVHELDNLSYQGSPELYAQMLDKIIANAVEFSQPSSQIKIRLFSENNTSKVAISNAGPSLPENMQQALFDSMISVRSEQNNDKPHLGLGLYIANMIAQYHKIALSIQNKQDEQGVVVLLSHAG